MENRSGLGQTQDQGRIGAEGVNPTYSIGGGGGGWVAKLSTFAASRRVMGWSTFNLFHSLICIIPRVLITNANRVCIVAKVLASAPIQYTQISLRQALLGL